MAVSVNIDLGKLSKPATVLIEKVSDAVGVIVEPHQIRRLAQAKADAAVIETKGQIQVTDIHRRAMARWIEEEGRKQENIEAITAKAIPYLDEDAKPEDVDDDWIVNFFDKCRIISNEDMQQLWGRVLAEEANAPQSFSRRTVNLMASLDKRDATSFTNLCRFVWFIREQVPLVYDAQEDDRYAAHGVTFDDLTHLDAIGLIRFEAMGGYFLKLPKHITVTYHGTPICLEFNNDSDNHLTVGEVFLTKVGQELAPITAAERDDEFFRFVLQKWVDERECRVASPLPDRPS